VEGGEDRPFPDERPIGGFLARWYNRRPKQGTSQAGKWFCGAGETISEAFLDVDLGPDSNSKFKCRIPTDE
jgi:hypothetical protein